MKSEGDREARHFGAGRKSAVPLYPFLASIYAVTALASVNVLHGVRPADLLLPLGVAALIPALTWVPLIAVIKDVHRRAFVTLLVVLVFASYGYVGAAIEGAGDPWHWSGTAMPVIIECAYVIVLAGLMFRMGLVTATLTTYLNIVTTILVAWSSAAFVFGIHRSHREYDYYAHEAPRPALLPVRQTGDRATRFPDIYLIILDKYTASSDLKKSFAFDNTPFERFLQSRGFVIPALARPNYVHTFLSVTSLLNFRYLDELPGLLGRDSPNGSFPMVLAENNRALGFLRGLGYRFVFFPSAFPVSVRNRNADLELPDPREITAEFAVFWRRSTLAEPILGWVCARVWCSEGVTSPISEPPALINWKFERLKALAGVPGPTFVVAHLSIPHEPYVFNADCSTRAPFWPPGFIPADQTPEKQAYVAQVQCLNKKLEDLVVHLLKNSPQPPVILLQADHGQGRMVKILDLAHTPPDRAAERARLFAAYYLPGAPKSAIYDSITPVNVFRVVFNKYFDARLPHQPNRTYWSSAAEPYRFTELH
jgi:hypothetical protein